MILIAILCPGLSFLLRGKLIAAILAIVLQVVACFTFLFFGAGFFLWLILAIWAVMSYNNAKADKRSRAILKAMRSRD
ncbi:YqaE/Pmp3 family membrane protein [Chitinophaga niabensis]|uniref:YqaE/Pmp3 family membrane protein n=1 Tax=Chitinophaga niabensis TaxID=536979 RepID=UPI0031BB7DCE